MSLFTIHIHTDNKDFDVVLDKLNLLINLTNGVKTKMAEDQVQLEASLLTIKASLDEAVAEIAQLNSDKDQTIANLNTVKAELEQRVADLEAAVLNTTISDQAQAALDAIKATSQALADVVPNVPVV
jgi:benzoyl-CoA reductase/2-hydroxyglutaryl-CoA dehydratase subunit BcrC/BadD/HgdB